MSVIFRTLKKLKAESTGAGKSTDKRNHGEKILSFNTARHPFASGLLLLVLFTVFGAGSIFGYYRLRDNNGKKVEASTMSDTDIRPSTNTPSLKPAIPSASNSIEYRPPDASHSGAKGMDSDKPAVAAARLAAVKQTTEASHAVSKRQAGQPDKSSTPQESTAPDVKKIFLSNAKKNAKIARLVADIRSEMDRGDKDRVETLFDELAKRMGQNNSYVLKLKAAWHIRNEEYEDAADLLRTVLSRNGLDLEAGLNMAIVEIRTGKEENAYRRLEMLQQTYPDSIRLAEMLRDLRRWFNGTQPGHFNRQNG
jgi:hypothetical protein